MGVILDTSVLIAAERGQFDLEAFTKEHSPDELVAISSIVATELLFAAEHALLRGYSDRHLRFAEYIFSKFRIHGFELADARIHARIGAMLSDSGRNIGAHDLLIAAICIRLDFELATLNTAEFSRVPGLKLVETARFIV